MSDQTSTPPDATPMDATPAAVTASPAAVSQVTDLDAAPDGTVAFASDAANLPEMTGEGGVITTARHGPVGWQLLAFTNRSRVIWQRTWHAGDRRWRSWKRFEDARNTGRATDAAIASAVTTAIDDLRAGLPAAGPDRDAVAAMIEDGIGDERAARNDAISAAISSLAAGRQALIDASITSAITTAITTERVAADQRADDKVARINARIDSVADDLTAEIAARTAAITAAGSAMEVRVTAERDARAAALAAQRRATAGEIAEARQDQAGALQTAILAERGARDQAISAAKSEVTRDTAAHVAGLLRGLEGRMARTIDTGIAAAGFPRGTRMLFQQSAAPTGWTKDATLNDKALRVTGGTAGSGGSVSFARLFNRNTRLNVAIDAPVSGRVGGHRLTANEMPSHSHSFRINTTAHDVSSPGILPNTGGGHSGLRFRDTAIEGTCSPAGADREHSHAAGSLRVKATAVGVLSLDVRYVDVIIAVKD